MKMDIEGQTIAEMLVKQYMKDAGYSEDEIHNESGVVDTKDFYPDIRSDTELDNILRTISDPAEEFLGQPDASYAMPKWILLQHWPVHTRCTGWTCILA